MSGIYIPNADMPEKGQVVYIFPDGTWQKAFLGMREPFQGGLVHPIPDHGRLGDLDELRKDWLENGENEYVYDTNSFLDSIDNAPTIIPADYMRGELDELAEHFVHTTNYGRIIRRTPEEMAELITAIISERDKTWIEKLAAAGIEVEIIEMPAKSVANHLAWLCEEAGT